MYEFTIEQLAQSAKVVGITITVQDDGRYAMIYTRKPEMRPLVLSNLHDVRLVILAEISDRLWELTSAEVAAADAA